MEFLKGIIAAILMPDQKEQRPELSQKFRDITRLKDKPDSERIENEPANR